MLQSIVGAIQAERLMRYMPAANHQTARAFQSYIWNCLLSESFHTTLHFAEIVCRNAFNSALTRRVGPNWYLNSTFHRLLDPRFFLELEAAYSAESVQHGAALTSHHIVSALTFGFWDYMAIKRFERMVWLAGVQAVFPCAPHGTTREDVQRLIESVRRWRNRIAHHRAIFDKGRCASMPRLWR